MPATASLPYICISVNEVVRTFSADILMTHSGLCSNVTSLEGLSLTTLSKIAVPFAFLPLLLFFLLSPGVIDVFVYCPSPHQNINSTRAESAAHSVLCRVQKLALSGCLLNDLTCNLDTHPRLLFCVFWLHS